MSTPVASEAIAKPQQVAIETDSYLTRLLHECQQQSVVNSEVTSWLQNLRQQAGDIVVKSRIPSKKDEEWRFSDLSGLLKLNLQLADEFKLSPAILEEFALPETDRTRLVFVNGVYAPELSNLEGLPAGVYVGNLAGLGITQKDKIVKYLAQQQGADETFTALNTSGLTDVAVVWANPNAIVDKPIHLLFLTNPSESPTFSQPRTLVVAERSSSLQLLENYGVVGEENSPRPYFTNAVTEIWLEENAQVNHSRIHKETGGGFHIGKSAIAQERDSRYTCNEISLGCQLYRHNLEVGQTGEQTETRLNGLIAIGGQQLADTHSLVSLTKPHGITDQLHKCIVGDRARAVFNGKIIVPKAAQLTNAAQLNRNLLLSPKARVNTKPELQITADNVKCSHGATVSQLEDDEVFYLRSRGLTESDARYLLIDAFAAEILQRLPVESLRKRLAQCIACRTMN